MSKVFKGVGKAFSSILGGGGAKVPKAPPPPVEMPVNTPDSAEALAAKRKSVALQRARGGRDSTILSQSDTLGGGY